MVPMMEVRRYSLAGWYSVLSCESHSMRVRPALRWSRALAILRALLHLAKGGRTDQVSFKTRQMCKEPLRGRRKAGTNRTSSWRTSDKSRRRWNEGKHVTELKTVRVVEVETVSYLVARRRMPSASRAQWQPELSGRRAVPRYF